MSAKKPFITGLGIGLIVASIVLETSHWLNQTAAIEIPQPNAQVNSTNAIGSENVDASNPSANQSNTSTDQEAKKLQQESQSLKDEVARLKKKLAVKPSMKLYIPNGSNSWSVSALLKEASIIPAQNEFLQMYQPYSNKIQFKKGFYSFREKMSTEDVLRVFGAPIPTPTPLASPSVQPNGDPVVSPTASQMINVSESPINN